MKIIVKSTKTISFDDSDADDDSEDDEHLVAVEEHSAEDDDEKKTNHQKVRLVQRSQKSCIINEVKQPTSEISTPLPRMAFVTNNADVGPVATPMFAESGGAMKDPEIPSSDRLQPSSDRLQHYLYNQSYQ